MNCVDDVNFVTQSTILSGSQCRETAYDGRKAAVRAGPPALLIQGMMPPISAHVNPPTARTPIMVGRLGLIAPLAESAATAAASRSNRCRGITRSCLNHRIAGSTTLLTFPSLGIFHAAKANCAGTVIAWGHE